MVPGEQALSQFLIGQRHRPAMRCKSRRVQPPVHLHRQADSQGWEVRCAIPSPLRAALAASKDSAPGSYFQFSAHVLLDVGSLSDAEYRKSVNRQ
jgi:hypothetical protein